VVEPSVGLRLATIDHLVPFHRSTNVLVAELVDLKPTAKQLVAVGHDTPFRLASVEPSVGFGLATIDQLVPSQPSTNVLLPELVR
jgi:hypothetical protein